jgi:hypothetical protein
MPLDSEHESHNPRATTALQVGGRHVTSLEGRRASLWAAAQTIHSEVEALQVGSLYQYDHWEVAGSTDLLGQTLESAFHQPHG